MVLQDCRTALTGRNWTRARLGKTVDTTPPSLDVSDEATTTCEEEYTSIRIDNANDIDRLLMRHDAVLQELDALSRRIEGLLVEATTKPAGLLVA